MYCSACGNAIAPGLSFCKRCGTGLNKDRGETKPDGIAMGLITAIVLVAIFGLGIMLGGALTLKNEGQLGENTIAFFLFLTFVVVGVTEILLLRQLSRLTGTGEQDRRLVVPPGVHHEASSLANEVRAVPLRTLPEPLPSVTESTTRTLHSIENP